MTVRTVQTQRVIAGALGIGALLCAFTVECIALVSLFAVGASSVSLADVIGFGGAFSLYYAVFGWAVVKPYVVAVPALLPLIAIALFLVLWVILPLPDASLDDAGKRALIVATGVALGWLSTWVAAEYTRAEGRRQTAEDAMVVLWVEIYAAVNVLDSTNWDDNFNAAARKILDDYDRNKEKGRYMPFTLTASPATLFAAVSTNLPLLKNEVAGKVAGFYSALSDLQSLAADLQREDVKSLGPLQRIQLHARISRQRKLCLQHGLTALYFLNDARGVDDPESPTQLPRELKNPNIKPKKVADDVTADVELREDDDVTARVKALEALQAATNKTHSV